MKYEGTGVYIKDVQMIQLEILCEVDRICKKHGVSYQLFAGTLLGAVRHKGFIPWDDDIDVCMLRNDYERFIKCCECDLKRDYFLQYYKSDKKSYLQFAKIRKNNTLFINRVEAGSGMHNGIFIDIFPLDNVSPNTLCGRVHPWIFNVLYIIGSSRVKGRAVNSKNIATRCIRLLFHFVLKLMPKICLDRLMQGVLRYFEGKNVKYVNHLTNGISRERLRRYLRVKETFYDTVELDFEGHLFPGPKNYQEVLKQNYGDYMKLPPKEKQYPHHGIYEIDLNVSDASAVNGMNRVE